MEQIIIERSQCCGCHACYAACPSNSIVMIEDEEGFLQPNIKTETCSDCGLCKAVCPLINKKHLNIKPNNKAYGAYVLDEKIRLNSSSGGLFTAIAENVIRKGGVVFGACFDADLKVVHDCISNIEDLKLFRGSKYVQSMIGEVFNQVKEVLLNDRYVLFTGTPCQIGGLLSYLGKSYDKLITQDIICHGVPSPKFWNEYIRNIQIKHKSDLYSFNFRDKRNGWNNYYVTYNFKNGTSITERATENVYMKAFFNDLCLRKSCYNCSFKTIARQADITLADFWGIDNVIPELNNEKGTSLISLNTYKGENIFKEISGDLVYKEVDIKDAIKYNPSMIKSVKCSKNRNLFMLNFSKGDLEKLAVKSSSKRSICGIAGIGRRICNKVKRTYRLIKYKHRKEGK
ncbi:MAG: Coenzyme F420 hydrogenase/dehydrogenase, beta subunit C-terminal domain [Bacillota bacterium]